jgi:indoleamine 2,3-dioxygenase
MDTTTDRHGFWAVDAKTGMLPAAPARLVCGAVADPITRVDEIAAALPHTSRRVLQGAIADLDVAEDLEAMSAASREAALRAYAFVAARCIHDDLLAPGRTLGRAVAAPLWDLARLVDRPPGLTYASYILANWSEPPAPRSQPEALLVLRTFSGTPDEAWFIAVHLAIESIGAEVVAAINGCLRSLDDRDGQALVAGLEAIGDAIRWASGVLARIREGVGAETFRTAVRPNLFGFSNVTFDVSPPVRVSYVGETGAQSGVIQALDSVLAVDHQPAMERALTAFRDCAPPPHKEYMRIARDVGRRIAEDARSQAEVKAAYINALNDLYSFRDHHATIVEHYLFADGPGTGGTSGHPWLRTLRDDVSRTIASLS